MKERLFENGIHLATHVFTHFYGKGDDTNLREAFSFLQSQNIDFEDAINEYLQLDYLYLCDLSIDEIEEHLKDHDGIKILQEFGSRFNIEKWINYCNTKRCGNPLEKIDYSILQLE